MKKLFLLLAPLALFLAAYRYEGDNVRPVAVEN